MTEERKGIYQVLNISLAATYDNHALIINGNILVAGQIPITVMARINDKKNKPVNLAIFRRIRMAIKKIYITTTATSATDLILFSSKDVEVDALGYGARSVLVDSLGVEYDARDIVDVEADNTIANLNNGVTYTGDQFATEGYASIKGMVFADRDLELYIDQSWDGTNYDESTEVDYDSGTVDGGYVIPVVAPYARLRVANTSGGNTTTLRAVAILSTGV